MSTPGTGPRQDLLHDLQYLRKGVGLSLARLAEADSVVRACGGYEQPMAVVRERLLSALRSLPQGRPRDALSAALDGEQAGPRLLRERRAAFAASVGRSSDTVADWENAALAELALRLMTAYYAGAATPGQLHIPHGGFLIQRLTVTTTIHDLVFVKSVQHRTLVSLVDGARGFLYGTYSPTVLGELAGCRLRESRAAPGGTMHELIFPRPLRRGQTASFGFTETVPEATADSELPAEDFAGQTFETPTLCYEQTVVFVGRQPEVIWSYDKLSRIERPGPLRPELAGPVVSKTFRDLYGGLAAGIAWKVDYRTRGDKFQS